MKKYIEIEKQTFLTFAIGSNWFALNIHKVLEVQRNKEITPVPSTAEFVLGIINFRGEILTVVDANAKLALHKKTEKTTPGKIIIIVELDINDRKVNAGISVEKVLKVSEVPIDQLKAVPEFGSIYNPEYLYGVFQINEKFVSVLNIDKIFTALELDFILEHSGNENE